MTKVSIVNVDLGIKISDLIAEDVAELTGQAKKELDTAIAIQRQVQKHKHDREQQKQQEASGIETCLTQAYQQLEAAGTNGVPITAIMELVKSHITTSSAFTMRMKHFLRAKDNPYILERSKRKGCFYYLFVPFNISQPDLA